MTPFEYDPNPADGWDVDGDAMIIAETEATPATKSNPPANRTADKAKRRLVFGTERPEILITETSAWEDDRTGELFVMLHRPWNAQAFARLAPGDAASDKSIAAEACDPLFDAYDAKSNPKLNPLDRVDLGRKSGNPWPENTDTANSDRYPIWRLRIEDDAGNTLGYIRFDTTKTGGNSFGSTTLTNSTTPWIAADGWTCIRGTNTLPTGQIVTFFPPAPLPVPPAPSSPSKTDLTPAFTRQVNDWVFDKLQVPGTAPAAGMMNRAAVIYLERLTDPTATPTDAQWALNPTKTEPSDLTPDQLTGMAIYRVVDQAPIEIVNRTPPDLITRVVPIGKEPKVLRRGTADPSTTFWNNFSFQPSGSMQMGLFTPLNKPAWFNWPNRPFVGSPELFLVHSLDSKSLLRKYTKTSLDPAATPDNWTASLLKTLNNPPLLDVVTVPTRFSGIHTTVGSNPASAATNLASLAGIDLVTTPVNQLSSFREPGRVNLNTVTATDVWNAVVAGPLVKDPSAALPEPQPIKTIANAAFGTTPAQSMTALLALSGSATAAQPPAEDDTNLTADLKAAKALNASQGLYTATRLSNAATTRSHLFGVWITLREAVNPGTATEPSDPDTVRYHRAFYIIDRSIPVAHEPGRDHNVWDAVLLRRVIE